MGATKIILADGDERYLSSLEMKFAEELDDGIDLEIITEETYFRNYFSKARQAEALVVNEEWYSPDLQRHNITNLFMLSERVDTGRTEFLDVKKIFKYTSTKEIYSQIIAASAGVMKTRLQQTKETLMILVYSPVGGIGKTTIALGIAACLAKNYKNVLYVDAERINSFQFYLKDDSPISNAILGELQRAGSDIFGRMKSTIRNEMFDYIPPLGAALSSLNLDYELYGEMIRSAKLTKNYDVIVVDTDNVFDFEKASLITQANKVVMLTDQRRSSVYTMNMLLKNMSCNDRDKFYFVCNDFDSIRENALLRDDMKPNFVISEYIHHLPNSDRMTLDDLMNDVDIQKVSFLVD